MTQHAILQWELTGDGMFAGVAGATVDPDHWPRLRLVTAAGHPVRLAPLVALMQQGVAEPKDGRIFVPHKAIAGLASVDADGIGLPPTLPFRLTIPRGKAGIASSQFRLAYHLLNEAGRAERVEARFGALISIRGTRYRVPSPQFEVMEGIDAFNAFPSTDPVQKIEAWARIREPLPDQVISDAHLRAIRVRHPTSVRLRTRERPDGSIDFDPELRTRAHPEHPEDEPESVQALDAAQQKTFEQVFRRFPSARSAYTTGQNTFVVVDEPLVQVLDVARRFQREPDPQRRRAFAENPTLFIRDALRETLSEEELLDVFEDGTLSDRVVGVTPWQAPEEERSSAGKDWVPAGEADPSLELGAADLCDLGDDALHRLKAQLERALTTGQREVALDDGKVVLAQPSVLRAVERQLVASTMDASTPPVPPERKDDGVSAGAPLVLGIADNVTELGYAAPIAARGGSGGTPHGLSCPLYEHQSHALAWLQAHWFAGHAGCLLADDMGLGKTLEALAFVAWLHEQMHAGRVPRRPTLIVAPSGLLKNWLDEHALHLARPGLGVPLQAFGPDLQGLREHGGKEMESGRPCLDVERMCRSEWVLTTYETLRDYQHSFARVPWGAAVFDEAQKIKNPATRMTWAAKAMNRNFSIALTGTPIENSLTDLWSIVDTVAPGRLGSLSQFKDEYGDRETSSEGETLKQVLMGDPQPALMLRRLKRDHLKGLPEREVHVLREEMPPPQARAYEAAVARSRGEGEDGRTMLRTLQDLRQISLCPRVRDEAGDDGFIGSSARLRACFSVLDGIHARGEKTLIFVELLDMQATLAEIIARRYALGSVPLIINGTMSGAARKVKVDRFQHRSGFDVMLISPKAGGVGLTLTAANHVIHLTRWWNPAVEDQCTDRVYRIGQDKRVHVYLPMAVHPEYGDSSFDIVLHTLLEDKRKLSRSVVPAASEEHDTRRLWRSAIGNIAAASPSSEAILGGDSAIVRQFVATLQAEGLPSPAPYDGLENDVGVLICEAIAAWPGHRLAVVAEPRPEQLRLWEKHGWTAVPVAEPLVAIRTLRERLGARSSAA